MSSVAVKRRPKAQGSAAAVLDALGWQAATFDQLSLRCGLSVGELAVVLDDLERDGWLVRTGSWFERVARDRR